MGDVHQLFDEVQRQVVEDRKASVLSSSNSGGTSGGMEARVAALEVKVDRLVIDVSELQKQSVATREDLATLKERVAHLPSKGYIATWVSGAVALIVAIVSAVTVFQHGIQAFFHLPS